MIKLDNYKAEDEFIEKFGLFLEKNSSFPRIAGKIYGYLLICEPPEQSARQLVERLNITKSSVSSMMRLLLQAQLVEELNLPGKRPRHYRIKSGAWEELFMGNLKALASARSLFGEGLSLLDNKESKKRIEDLDELYAFFEKKMPSIIDEWKKYKGSKK